MTPISVYTPKFTDARHVFRYDMICFSKPLRGCFFKTVSLFFISFVTLERWRPGVFLFYHLASPCRGLLFPFFFNSPIFVYAVSFGYDLAAGFFLGFGIGLVSFR